MNGDEIKCITALKVEVGKQGERINALAKTIGDYHEDIRELFDERKKIGERVVAVEQWQNNFDKNQTNRLTVLGVVIAIINVFTVIVAFVLGRGRI